MTTQDRYAYSDALSSFSTSELYKKLLEDTLHPGLQAPSRLFLEAQLLEAEPLPCELPDRMDELEAWMTANAHKAMADYAAYLEQRKAGAPRRYFSNRAHALYFLRSVAPTKLVDGSWLYGVMAHWRNPRLHNLIHTYLEELGEGNVDKNHVVLYRQLLARHGLDLLEDMREEDYLQGLTQLALACHAQDFLPEVIGFNLGYEQLPLHLFITAYELNELGIDPYYFTLHVTVDNADTGHARRAVQAVQDNMPHFGDEQDFWQRVKAGYQLNEVGVSTCQLIDRFDIQSEVVRIFQHKSRVGHGAHSDYCRVAGRSVNDWLARPEDVPEFLNLLEEKGWIQRPAEPEQSRFWQLLQGDKAEMFGVFTAYELQVIHDWLRGDAAQDGRPYHQAQPDTPARQPSFRVAARLAASHGKVLASFSPATTDMLDTDLQALQKQLTTLDAAGQMDLLVQALAPSQHWTPAGLFATQAFCQRVR